MKRAAVNLKSVKSSTFAHIHLHSLIYAALEIPKRLQKRRLIAAISWKSKGNRRKRKLRRTPKWRWWIKKRRLPHLEKWLSQKIHLLLLLTHHKSTIYKSKSRWKEMNRSSTCTQKGKLFLEDVRRIRCCDLIFILKNTKTQFRDSNSR